MPSSWISAAIVSFSPELSAFSNRCLACLSLRVTFRRSKIYVYHSDAIPIQLKEEAYQRIWPYDTWQTMCVPSLLALLDLVQPPEPLVCAQFPLSRSPPSYPEWQFQFIGWMFTRGKDLCKQSSCLSQQALDFLDPRSRGRFAERVISWFSTFRPSSCFRPRTLCAIMGPWRRHEISRWQSYVNNDAIQVLLKSKLCGILP